MCSQLECAKAVWHNCVLLSILFEILCTRSEVQFLVESNQWLFGIRHGGPISRAQVSHVAEVGSWNRGWAKPIIYQIDLAK